MRVRRWHIHLFGGLLPALLLAVGCGSGTGPTALEEPSEADIPPFTPGIRVSWDARTRIRVEDGASYARMIRLDDGRLLLAYGRAGRLYVRHSADNGRTWTSRRLAAEAAPSGVSAHNAELVQLDDGTVLLPYNVRAGGSPDHRYALKLNASTDGGETWTSRATVFEAGVTGNRGVWEPIILSLSSGDFQLYAANEYPYPDNEDQEITMWRSSDQGQTWSDGMTISYRPGHRDGMPVPLLLRDGSIALAIEDNGLGGPFKPAIVWTPSTEEAWSNAPIGGNHEQRWRALSGQAQLPTEAYGGAPYLAQFPTGEVLLSFQSTAGRTLTGDPVAHSTMAVGVGNSSARAFDRLSEPFNVPPGDRAVWNALFVKDSSTVTAITTTTAYTSADRQQLFTIDGHRIPEPSVSRGEVEIDGRTDEDVWARSTTLPVGPQGQKTADVKTAWTPTHLSVSARVVDAQPPPASTTLKDEAVVLTLASDSLARNAPVDGAFRLRVNTAGRARLDAGRAGDWQPVDAPDVEIDVSLPEAVTTPAFDGTTRTIEARLPWTQLSGHPEVGVPWGLTVGIVDDGRPEEYVGGTNGTRPTTWLRTTLAE